jgi:hypothetical protein
MLLCSHGCCWAMVVLRDRFNFENFFLCPLIDLLANGPVAGNPFIAKNSILQTLAQHEATCLAAYRVSTEKKQHVRALKTHRRRQSTTRMALKYTFSLRFEADHVHKVSSSGYLLCKKEM